MTSAGRVIIRKASDADLAGVLALYAQPEMDDGDVLSVEEAASILRRFDRYPDYALYVAEADGHERDAVRVGDGPDRRRAAAV